MLYQPGLRRTTSRPGIERIATRISPFQVDENEASVTTVKNIGLICDRENSRLGANTQTTAAISLSSYKSQRVSKMVYNLKLPDEYKLHLPGFNLEC